MKLQKLHIKNFKSILDLEIVEPNPFTVFVGPNGSGKSNIFEALEFSFNALGSNPLTIESLFGGEEAFLPYGKDNESFQIKLEFIEFEARTEKLSFQKRNGIINQYRTSFFENDDLPKDSTEYSSKGFDPNHDFKYGEIFEQFFYNHSRIFVKNVDSEKFRLESDFKLSASASNLEKVLKRILQDEVKREEIKEWLDLFIPGFENIEIVSSELRSTDILEMYEKGIKKPFPKDLLSDGTYNILALLTAVFQSDEPQFLCIEEPENGLHPEVIKELVSFFREACIEKGHYIWLNTHSQTLVSALQPEEIILVNKRNGETQIKQVGGKNLHGLAMDEAWLTNALGGGLTW